MNRLTTGRNMLRMPFGVGFQFMVMGSIAVLNSVAGGDAVLLRDDFRDPSASASIWVPGSGYPGDYAVVPDKGFVFEPTSESLIVGRTNENPGQRQMYAESTRLASLGADHISMRTRIRKEYTQPHEHGNVAFGGNEGDFWASLNPAGRTRLHYGDLTSLQEATTDVDITQEDAILQLDIRRENGSPMADLELRIWRTDEMMPAIPQRAGRGRIDPLESISLWSNAGRVGSDDEFSPTIFRSLDVVARTQWGDFNDDGAVDADDINALHRAIRNGSDELLYDINQDGPVTADDATFWIHELKNSFLGDANLDGEFNSNDLLAAFQAAEYEDAIALNSGWVEGDFNGDGDFNSGDLLKAFADGGFEMGPRTVVVAAVPEPASVVMLVAGVMGIAIRRRHVCP